MYLPSLFDGSGGNVAHAVYADSANGVITTNAGAPAATDPGVTGQMFFADNYTYRCFGSGDWRRMAVTYTTY